MQLTGDGQIIGLQAGGLPNGSVLPADTQVGATPSCVSVHTSNGSGSVNTAVRRFTTMDITQGTDITYADSPTLGATFTVNVDGVYAITYTDAFAVSNYLAVSKNSAQLTTSASAISAADRLCLGTTQNTDPDSTGVTVPLLAGTVIRAHTGISPGAGGIAGWTRFTITRVA